MFNSIKTKWHEIIAAAALISIFCHFILSVFVLDNSLSFFGFLLDESPLILLIIFGGLPLMLQILLKAFKGDLGADLLAFIALIVAVYLGEFLAAALVVLMLSSGQALEVYAVRKASFVLEALAKRMPSIAHKKVGNKVFDITISEIQIGDLIEIYPHEICPVDATVVVGNGNMDESFLTGEPYQISKTSGSLVLSGAINGNAALTIRADKLPQDSRYLTIMKVMENAENNRPKMRKLADQIGAVFAPLALIFAIATFVITKSATNFLAVLVVATPCPLLIAVPITIISAISIAARHGIIIKDPAILEKLPICETAIFDKTGTLTLGKPELVNILTFNNFDKNEILQMVASVEKYSRHPLAESIINASSKENLQLLEVENLTENPGQGLFGNINGKHIMVTHRKKITQELQKQISELPLLEQGLECLILIDNEIAAIFHFRDEVRHDSHSFVSHLGPAHNFKKIMLVSGDRDSEVKYLASFIDIKETHSGQTPEQKLAIVREENSKTPTLFMGDGINDAPALTAATVGIAFGQHNGITSEAAGAVIMEHSLTKVDQLIHISESTRAIALQSAIGGMALSFVGMVFAAAGTISPVQGALLQEIIDVVAILNSLRLAWKNNVETDLGNN
ncbi:MAG: cadmium-translocating P-type ATPase [Rickettsiales bacterium]|nr:cadmium-translocating P-type ATPase [Rickettsiales bacterium]